MSYNEEEFEKDFQQHHTDHNFEDHNQNHQEPDHEQESETESKEKKEKPAKPGFRLNTKKFIPVAGGAVVLLFVAYKVIHIIHPGGPTPSQIAQTNFEQQQTQKRLTELSEKQANMRPATQGPNSQPPGSPAPDGTISDETLKKFLQGQDVDQKPEQSDLQPATSQPIASSTQLPQPTTPLPAVQTQPTAPLSGLPGQAGSAQPTQNQNTKENTTGSEAPATATPAEKPVTNSLSDLSTLPNSFNKNESLEANLPGFTAPTTTPKTTAMQHLVDQYSTIQNKITADQTELDADQKELIRLKTQIEASRTTGAIPVLPGDPTTQNIHPDDIPTNVIPDTELLGITKTGASFRHNGKIVTAHYGDIIDGIGHITSPAPWNGTWELVTDSGLVRPKISGDQK